MYKPTEDLTAIENALKALTIPGQTFEIRALHERKYKGMQGYFNDPEAASDYIGRLDGDYKGIYFTLNPVNPELIHRASNRLKQQAEGLGTFDPDVTRRIWLPIDIDPKRVSNIASTDDEHIAALKLARTIASTLDCAYGFPEPGLASSGNGAHLLYPIDVANDDEARDAIKAFLHAVKFVFGTPELDIDTSVFNASRIWRLYGTVARKGDNTEERPWRQSVLVVPPDRGELLTLDAINGFTMRNGGQHAKPSAISIYERTYPADEGQWRVLNRAALDRLPEWVEDCFGDDAQGYQQGYRISSNALGRDLEEDLTIHPWPKGVKDFGTHDNGEVEEGKRTPISLIAGFMFSDDKEAAAKWLSEQLGMTTSEFEKVAKKQLTEKEDDDYENVFQSSRSAAKAFNKGGIRDAQGLMQKKFRELTWLVEDLIPEGAFFLSSRPKMRKSWMVLQLGLAVASGGEFMGKKVNQGEVLGLFLEDNDRRMQRRIETLYTFKAPPDMSNFHYWTPGNVGFDETFPRGVDGCQVIREWLTDHPKCKLVIIDTFAHFRGHETGRSGNVYQLDYESVMPITRLATEFQCTVIIVHHERKGSLKESNDFIEDTSGSTGLTGGVDGIMAIKGKRGASDENETRQLAITGRDVVHDYLIDIAFDAELGGWRPAAKQDAGESLLELLRKYPVLKLSELYSLLPNISQSRIRQVLLDMRHEGKVENTAGGYRLPGV